jgi:phosphoglycolate phosphatase
MAKKVIIFDFDGTIADTLDSIANIANCLSDEFGWEKLKQEDMDRLRNKEPKEVLKDLGISMIKLPSAGKKLKQN